MTKAADILEHLLARRQGTPVLERKTGLPYGWNVWLRRQLSPVMAFDRQGVAELLVERPAPASKPASPALTPLQAFWQLRWHDGERPPRDQRGMRWLAAACSAGLHVLFAILLLWVALVRTPPVPEDASEGERVQVEYLGRGTPDDEGGGAPASLADDGGAPGASPQAAAAATPVNQPAAQSESSTPAASASPPVAEAVESTAVDAPAPTPDVAQPLQVTETSTPTANFVLPPTNTVPVRVDAPQLRTPEIRVQARVIDVLEEAPPAPRMKQAVVTAQPNIAAPQIQVRERAIEVAPQAPTVTSHVQSRDLQAQLRTPEMSVREVQIPAAAEKAVTPSPVTPAAVSGAATAGPAKSTAAAGASRPSVTPSAATGSSPGAGPRSQDQAGGWASPVRADDWGASKRTAAGGAGQQADTGKGLFSGDGRVRLPGEGGHAGESKRGAPGGKADSWSRDRIADSGTWLKRPPYDYTPTSFDKYWVPNESLLAEWVRSGVKNIQIPIPGTNSSISCVVSLLQLGGGCGLNNPNMQDQPAEARPPPDIPFKKELQEDNGSR